MSVFTYIFLYSLKATQNSNFKRIIVKICKSWQVSIISQVHKQHFGDCSKVIKEIKEYLYSGVFKCIFVCTCNVAAVIIYSFILCPAAQLLYSFPLAPAGSISGYFWTLLEAVTGVLGFVVGGVVASTVLVRPAPLIEMVITDKKKRGTKLPPLLVLNPEGDIPEVFS